MRFSELRSKKVFHNTASRCVKDCFFPNEAISVGRGGKHPVFFGGHPSNNLSGSMSLNFSERTTIELAMVATASLVSNVAVLFSSDALLAANSA